MLVVSDTVIAYGNVIYVSTVAVSDDETVRAQPRYTWASTAATETSPVASLRTVELTKLYFSVTNTSSFG
jgi:hypothetical protein